MNKPITICFLPGEISLLVASLESETGARIKFRTCVCKGSASTFRMELSDEKPSARERSFTVALAVGLTVLHAIPATKEIRKKAKALAVILDYGGTDTTVMGKALTHPTNAKLVAAGRRRLVKQAQEAMLKLWQNHHRVGPALSVPVARYAHARQGKRLAQCLKHHKTIAGKVVRDIERQLPQVAPGQLAQRWQQAVTLVRRVLAQKRTDKGKVHRLHEPQVDCIAKGKSRHRHECGTQVSVTAT